MVFVVETPIDCKLSYIWPYLNAISMVNIERIKNTLRHGNSDGDSSLRIIKLKSYLHVTDACDTCSHAAYKKYCKISADLRVPMEIAFQF